MSWEINISSISIYNFSHISPNNKTKKEWHILLNSVGVLPSQGIKSFLDDYCGCDVLIVANLESGIVNVYLNILYPIF